MILQSKFHDYYDSVLTQHRDPKIVYSRDEIELDGHLMGSDPNLKKLITRYCFGIMRRIGGCEMGEHSMEDINAVVFCGKVYPVGVVEIAGAMGTSCKTTRDYRTPFSLIQEKHYLLSKDENSFMHSYNGEGISDGLAEDVCRKHAPIIYLKAQGKSILNPRLVDLHFPVHAVEAAQTLLQFMSPRDPGMVGVSDKFKVLGHGFDNASFRREPGGPTRKRKRAGVF